MTPLHRLAVRLSPPTRRVLRLATLLFALFFLGLAAAWARFELRLQLAGSPPPSDVFVLPAPGAARMLAAGFTEAAADAVWARSLVYHGEKFAKKLDSKNLHAYLDALTTLDPMFRSPYAWSGYAVVFAHWSGIPQPADLDYAVRLLRLGLERFPDDPELHGILGYQLYYELPRWVKDPELLLRAKVEGAEHIRRQAQLGGGPPWLVLSAATALEKLNLDDLAARHLEQSAHAVDDPELRAQVLDRLARLRSSVDLDAMRVAGDTLFGVARRRLPWVSGNQFLMLSSPEAQARMAEGLMPEPFVEDSP
ncbi:MAG: hypothetical protein JXB32_16975 [Deltaproteobacteria bacterium]|nr:hypothetical protein [Deltaproteobacteria bacterium]